MKKLYLFLILMLGAFYLSFSQGVDFSKTGNQENSERFRTLQISGHGGGHLYSGQSLTSKLEGYGIGFRSFKC
ncbi:MAG: hypothetical protein WBM43_10400 [Flavobacteriaceae bacterium]